MTTLSKKILVVDDEESIREIMKIKLVKLGYVSEFTKNRKEAIHTPFVILLGAYRQFLTTGASFFFLEYPAKNGSYLHMHSV